jgi:hypothetical protein
VVNEIRQSLGNPEAYAGGMSMDDIAQAIYARNSPIYNQPLSSPWEYNYQIHDAIQQAGRDSSLNLLNKRALLGDYFGTTPGCVGNVCYENAILGQAVGATYRQPTVVGSFSTTNASGEAVGHAANLYVNNEGVLSVADPTFGVSGTLEQYYQYIQKIGLNTDGIMWVTERIFIPIIPEP